MSQAADHGDTCVCLFDSDPTYENLLVATRGWPCSNTDGYATSGSGIPKQRAESFAADWLRAFSAASRGDPGLTQMIRDQLRRLERVAARRVHNQLSGRHFWTIEDAVFVELAELVHIAELAES